MKHLINYSIFENSNLLDALNKAEIESICGDLRDMLYELKFDGYSTIVQNFYYQPGNVYFPIVLINSNKNLINNEVNESIFRIYDYMMDYSYQLGSVRWDFYSYGKVKISYRAKCAYVRIDEFQNWIGSPFDQIQLVFDPVDLYWEDVHRGIRRTE